MIPVDSMTISGSLARSELQLKIPIRNKALDIAFDQNIDRASLWWAWSLLKRAGLKDVRSIEFQKQ
jgi:hypothetical protein